MQANRMREENENVRDVLILIFIIVVARFFCLCVCLFKKNSLFCSFTSAFSLGLMVCAV